MNGIRSRAIVVLTCLALSVTASGQANLRRVTNLPALAAFPSFYHLRPVTIAGALELRQDGRLYVNDGTSSLRVVYEEGAPEGPHEIRGEFWDLGRMNPDNPRLATLDLRAVFQIDPDGPWPRPGQVTAFLASAVTETALSATPSIRNIVLNPAQYLDQTVTLTGQFSGRNLLGELPDAPGNSQYDFVIRSADAAIWVSNIRPRGKDFDLALDARLDTGRWLEVTGVLQQARGLQWINARDGKVTLTKPPAQTTMSGEEPVRVPAAAPPQVLFSAPTEGEIDVEGSTNIRIQFSRDIDPSTFKDRIRMTYRTEGGEAAAATFTTEYRGANRLLEIRPTEPLERFRTVQIELLNGIQATDAQPLEPWTLTFTTGG